MRMAHYNRTLTEELFVSIPSWALSKASIEYPASHDGSIITLDEDEEANRGCDDAGESRVHLVATGTVRYRKIVRKYGQDKSGKIYRLPDGLEHPAEACTVDVGADGRVSVNDRISIDWKQKADSLTTLPDGIYTILQHRIATKGGKRKLCLQETDKLYFAQTDVDVEHARKFRKMGTYRESNGPLLARIEMIHNNAAC
ncbi:hypothetical protein CYMTET_40257 [Cymbomonas tetramitiformis]|uniref:Uncharacterized protein n=1 Tax=Cymbomonas tetramitiformis TaxID=36881 RepID=A0AAE0C8F0_9CHLO|nr:hypothetical protein CYMTET_40257 [Cymbomonas tetramitiformis]